jgi:hypothetical protein
LDARLSVPTFAGSLQTDLAEPTEPTPLRDGVTRAEPFADDFAQAEPAPNGEAQAEPNGPAPALSIQIDAARSGAARSLPKLASTHMSVGRFETRPRWAPQAYLEAT